MAVKPTPTSRFRRDLLILGQERAAFTDLYHRVQTIPVGLLLLLLAGVYVAINAAFALLYMLDPGSITHAKAGSFLDAFFFSVQTLSTVGYGDESPSNLYGNCIVTLEAFFGVINIAVTTGLVFARVSKPTARVMFSRVAIITQFDGVPTLMFRAANQRGNQILEAQVMVNVARSVVTAEGHTLRALVDLPVVRARSPLFALSWTIMHRLDETSPLHGQTADSMLKDGADIIVVLSGVDETFAQRIHARYVYSAEEILWDKQFVDILAATPEGRRSIDYRKFHDVRDVEVAPTH